jgi:hypothetical protein
MIGVSNLYLQARGFLMSTVTHLAETLQELLTSTANELARPTGFVERGSKITGAIFTQAVTLGWLENPEATLEELAQQVAALGVRVSPQGLDYRLNDRAAELLKQVLYRAVQRMIAVDPVAIPLLQRFPGVYVQDSTTLTLPNELAQVWEGCGGSGRVGQSALKVQVQFDLCSGCLSHLDLQNGRAQDRNAPVQTAPLPAGALRLADLGYFSVAVFQALSQAGVYWLSRYQARIGVWDEQGERLELPSWLARQTAEALDQPIQLSDDYREPGRLLAVRVPSDVAARRRRQLRVQARKKGQAVSRTRLALAAWTIFVTNVPAEKLSVAEALVLGRCRWQIELLFDRWKTHSKVGQSRSAKPWHILCELYGKLLAMVIQHWLLLVSCWRYPNRSLRKATKTIRKYATQILVSLHQPLRLAETVTLIQQCLGAGCRINKRKASPSTFQLLLAVMKCEPLP